MKYEWENKITQDMLREMQDILPDGFILCGVAVGNPGPVEAALIMADDAGLSGISTVDVWSDLMFDAERNYSDAVASLFPE